jgi:recombination protein RecT
MGYKAHKGYTFWEKDFDGMACKTMLRQLISKWGVMSIDLQKAVASDMGVIGQSGSVDYIDTPTEAPQAQPEQPHVVDVEPMPDNVPPDDDFAALLEG